MNSYAGVVSDTIDYIECNLREPLTLEQIADRFNVSLYHFVRLFSAMTGTSPKRYILGRRLTLALERLAATGDSIIDIALDLGFEYPEVFSRAFRKQFGLSPSEYRAKRPATLQPVGRATVMLRDVVNYQGLLTLKASFTHRDMLSLEGVSVDVDIEEEGFEAVLDAVGSRFLQETAALEQLDQSRFYSVVSCHGHGDGLHTVYFGKHASGCQLASGLEPREVPGGWYASFHYENDMAEARTTIVEDLYRWVSLKGIELRPNGVGMLTIYPGDYEVNRQVQVLVPVVRPQADC